MQVTVGQLTFNAYAVNVARLIGTTAGYDIDLEPMAPGTVRVTATSQSGQTLRATGHDAEAACLNIINKLAEVMNGR